MSILHNPPILLPPNQQLAAPDKFPVVGEKFPRANNTPWTLTVTGLVAVPQTWTLAELLAMPQETHVIDVHCVTRWSKPAMTFTGISLSRILDLAQPLSEAQFLSFVARSERNHSTSLPLADALTLGTIIAFTINGQPLTTEHGAPMRTVVPGRYFYKSLKWLETMELLAEDRLGYWESESGYHNVADPWREERYIAPAWNRQALQKALAERNFRSQDFRSLAAARLDLSGLNAFDALLRDADFRHAVLVRACFDRANLSNAHLENADVRDATFRDADVEGANFCGADLRGADFTGASLFGATFCPEPHDTTNARPAQIDPTTRILPAALDKLTPHQREFVLLHSG